MPFIAHSRAIIVPQRGAVPVEKQYGACLRHAMAANYRLAAICWEYRPEDVIDTITRGVADVVLVAVGGQSIAPDVTAAGGRVVAVHPTPHLVVPRPRVLRGAIELIQRMRLRGQTPKQIAALVGESTGDISAILREHPPRPV